MLSVFEANKANMLWHLGDNHQARAIQKKLLLQSRQLEEWEQVISRLLSLTYIEWSMQNYSIAKELLEEAYVLYHQKNMRSASTMCELLSGLGIIHTYLGNPEKAKHYHEQALDLAKETSSPLHQSSTFLDFAHTLIQLGDTTRAEHYLQQSISVLWAGNDRGRLLIALIQWAKNELAKGDTERAAVFLGCVLTQAELAPKDQKSAHEVLSSIRKHLSQKEINTFLKQARTLSLEQLVNDIVNTKVNEDIPFATT